VRRGERGELSKGVVDLLMEVSKTVFAQAI
jgi:hypothetical protein